MLWHPDILKALVDAAGWQSPGLDSQVKALVVVMASKGWGRRHAYGLLKDLSEAFYDVRGHENDFLWLFGRSSNEDPLWAKAFTSWWAQARLNGVDVTEPIRLWRQETSDPLLVRFMDKLTFELADLVKAIGPPDYLCINSHTRGVCEVVELRRLVADLTWAPNDVMCNHEDLLRRYGSGNRAFQLQLQYDLDIIFDPDAERYTRRVLRLAELIGKHGMPRRLGDDALSRLRHDDADFGPVLTRAQVAWFVGQFYPDLHAARRRAGVELDPAHQSTVALIGPNATLGRSLWTQDS